MATPTYEEALRLFVERMDAAIAGDSLVQKPVKFLLLGAYALQALMRSYGSDFARDTHDIDFYAPETPALVGAGLPVGPTGARLDLKPDFHAEFFGWISGVDHQQDLEQRLAGQLADEKNILKAGENCRVYSLSPELFVVNKLFSYRGQRERGKDLRDVNTLVSVLREKDAAALQRVETLVGQYGLGEEYQLALEAPAVNK